jgi:hypothetical protein
MKKIISLLMGVSVAVLAAGCSDDSSPSVSCTFSVGTTVDMCGTGSGTDSDCTKSGGKVVSSCPANALLTCPESKGTMYYYNQAEVDAMKAANSADPCSF